MRESQPAARDEHSEQTILVVDDNASDLKIINSCLKESGYRTAIATSGAIALERVKRILPDLVLLDVIMPDIKGFDVCRQLKEDPDTKDIPVIFMTGLTSAEDKVSGFRAGAIDYITKPIFHEELLARVRIHLQIQQLAKNLHDHSAELEHVNEQLVAANNEIQALNRQLNAENFRMREDLQVSRQRFLTLAEEVSDGYIVLDAGLIAFANQAFCHMHDYALEETLGKEFSLFVIPEDRERMRTVYARMLQEGDGKQVCEYKGLTRDKRELPIEMNLKSTVSDGNPVMIGILRDISERLELEEKMRQEERMAAIGRLTTSLSHEIRNPLAAIKMNLQVLQKFHPFEGEDRRCMELSLDEVTRLENTLSDLLDFAKPPRLHFSPCALHDVLCHCVELLRTKFEEKEVRLIQNADQTLPAIRADREKLTQVLLNLLLNALDVSQAGQSVWISTFFCLNKENPAVVVCVEDEGPGIPEKLIDRIFYPFFSTKSKGTGIGLTNVKHLIEAHKGWVEASNRTPRGAIFQVWLPVESSGE